MNEEYKVIIEGGTNEVELKKSRFIAHVAKAETEEEAVNYVNQIKKQYYDARHNCYAYIIGKDADRVKYSDDGEPAQTAGLPIFTVLKESGVRNVVVVVTRYFGGTLLGAGPLTRMYVEATKEGLNASVIGTMKFGVEAMITTDYAKSESVKYYLDKENINIMSTDYSDKVSFTIRLGKEAFEALKQRIIELTASKVEIIEISNSYFVDTTKS